MRKIDPAINEEVKRTEDALKENPSLEDQHENETASGLTDVKNAHATGVGSMGWNDEKLGDGDNKEDKPTEY